MDLAILKNELERDESLRLKIYADNKGIPTIGIGRNLRDVGISKDEAYRMLANDIEKVVADLDQYVAWWRSLDEVRQRVLVNMGFNLGVRGFRADGSLRGLVTFTNLLSLIQRGLYGKAADDMMGTQWAKDVGIRAVRLSDMMRRGSV